MPEEGRERPVRNPKATCSVKKCLSSTCHPLLSECLYRWRDLSGKALPDAFDGDAAVIASLMECSEEGTKIFPISAGSRTVSLFSDMDVREERRPGEHIIM